MTLATGLKGVILLMASCAILVMDKLFVDMLLSPEHITWMAEPNIIVLSTETIVLFTLSIAQVVIAIELISAAPAVSRFLRKFKAKLR